MAGTLSLKSVNSAPKQLSRTGLTIPIIIVFLIGFFFVSSLKVRVVYSTAPSNSVDTCSADCKTYQQIIPDQHQPEQIKPKRVTHPVLPKPTTFPFTIVTASSANHLCSLENFLYSLYDLRSQVNADEFPRIVVYNIGMNRTQLPVMDQFVENGLVDDLETFDYFKYPRFWDVAINAGEYAWKTGIVHEASIKYTKDSNGILVWLDAGNIVTPEFLRSIASVIRKSGGFWSPRSSKHMAQWTHPGMYEYYDADPEEYARNSNCNGAAIGFDTSNKTIMDTVIKPWLDCGLDKNCIAPPGSSRINHRQDQAALTFLAYRSGHKCHKSPTYYKLQTHRDSSCRSDLVALDIQGKLNHPSSTDYPKWYSSNTLQLYHHPEWRYAQDKVPEHLAKMMYPPAGFI
ncbi:hypothetical protein EDC94DRAFT_593768 [Helicostylum pulchrum]|uniref:Uncharacterized protein n=1 Tax=Helicostylum pulchrum TaxID=562976 RepID=A0ABP9XUI2_9FUNG|nr:hypothetical protein EDC94DRAFT_593768 [Helicostylum pulchrum]